MRSDSFLGILIGLTFYFNLTFHVFVLIAELFCLAESNSVDDGCMVEGVRENRVLGTQKLLKQSGIGVETTSRDQQVWSKGQ